MKKYDGFDIATIYLYINGHKIDKEYQANSFMSILSYMWEEFMGCKTQRVVKLSS
jgi:hypothetical protein